MLGAKLAYDPKTKVVPLIKYYNFALVHTSMKVSIISFKLGQTYYIEMMTNT